MRVKRRGRLIAFLILPLLIAVGAVLGSIYLRVSEVSVKGNVSVPHSEIITLAGIARKSSILTLNEKEITARIQTNPYIRVVSVERIFPNKVCLHVAQREAVAQVEFMGGYMLIDEGLFIMELVQTKDKHLPVISGAQTLNFQKGQVFETEESKKTAMSEVITNIGRWANRDKLLKVDISDAKNITMEVVPEYKVIIGPPSHLDTKLRLADSIIEDCNREGKSGGTVDVRDAANDQGFFASPQPSPTATDNSSEDTPETNEEGSSEVEDENPDKTPDNDGNEQDFGSEY
jgi:cell division protein FtsQ